MSKILIVDDEPSIIDALKYHLEQAGYDTAIARDGAAAIELARQDEPDLIILDLMLPFIDGFDVCRILRRESDVPIIMLTARDEEIDRVVGLELGADDYVVKPFSMRELVARVKTVLRRSSTGPASDADLEVGRLRLVPSRHEAFWDHECLELTSLEFDLLHTLMIHENHVLTRSQLLDQVWGYEYHGDLRVVDTAVKRLRARLRAMDPGAVETIVTIRGVGYKLVQG